VAAAVAVHLWNAGDWMPHYRLLVPAIAPLVVAVVSGIGALRALAGSQRIGTVVYCVGAVLITLLAGWRQSFERGLNVAEAPREAVVDHFGMQLAKIRRDDDLLATDVAGRVPYESNMRTLDLFGLCDKTIAKLGTSGGRFGKQYWPRVAELRPSLFYFQGPGEFRKMYSHSSFGPLRNEYLYVRTPELVSKKFFLLVRKDRPDQDKLREVLRADLWPLERAGILPR
jgi:hypothetical protein